MKRSSTNQTFLTDASRPVEVVIVGSGAAASVMAALMAEGGKSVLLLETGAQRKSADLISSQIWGRRMKWGGAPVLEAGRHSVANNFNLGQGTGGSAMHQYAVWPRLHPTDFTLATQQGVGLDWPIKYGDLRPYYDRVQEEVGISGDAAAEHWRPEGAPYPMGPVPVFAQARLIAEGFDRLNLSTSALPLAINTRIYKGRPACLWDGWCDAGCPIGALANPLTVYLPRAQQAGAVLRHNATVTRVLTDKTDRRVRGVEYVQANGESRYQAADLVVLAANPIQNPRILLASRTRRSPKGLANSSGMLGAYLMSHPTVSTYGLFNEETHCYLGPTGGQLLCQDGYQKDQHPEGAFGSYQWMIAQALKPNDLLGIANSRPDLSGAQLTQFMAHAAHHIASMAAVCEGLPLLENQVRLSTRSKDEYGVPLAEVTHSFAPSSLALAEVARQEGEAVFCAAGATEVWSSDVNAMHIMGGTVMGASPELAVTNSYGQTHDIPNLIIAGAGLFPTSGGVNPTFTIHALAHRTAKHLLDHWPA